MTDIANSSSTDDPRVFFAAERTMLAWLRTGIAITGLGFLVARFGLFLSALPNHASPSPHFAGSSMIGIGFVLLGASLIGASAYQHARFIATLNLDQRPKQYWTHFSVIIAVGLAILSNALAVYLFITAV